MSRIPASGTGGGVLGGGERSVEDGGEVRAARFVGGRGVLVPLGLDEWIRPRQWCVWVFRWR
jgi:hypothetical protein